MSSNQTTPVKPPDKKKYVWERLPSPVVTVDDKTPSPPESPQEDTAGSQTRNFAPSCPVSTQPTSTRTAKSPPGRPVRHVSFCLPPTPCDTYKTTLSIDVTLPIETYYRNHWVVATGFTGLCLDPKDALIRSSIFHFSQPIQVFHMQHSSPIGTSGPPQPVSLRPPPEEIHRSNESIFSARRGELNTNYPPSLSPSPSPERIHRSDESIYSTLREELNINYQPPPVPGWSMNPGPSHGTRQPPPPNNAVQLAPASPNLEIKRPDAPPPSPVAGVAVDPIVGAQNPSNLPARRGRQEEPDVPECTELYHDEWNDQRIGDWHNNIPQASTSGRQP